MPKFKIQHTTKYTYEVPVRDSANQLMLYPLTDEYQTILFHHLAVTGNPVIERHNDHYGNIVGTFTHSLPHQELTIDSRLEVQTTPKPLPEDTETPSKQWKIIESLQQDVGHIDFLRLEHFSALAELKKNMEELIYMDQTPYAVGQRFCNYVFDNFEYKKGITTVDSTLDEIWKIKSGVCQDFAHILLAMLRLMQIPARYVSGYICPNKNGMRGEGATHAWVEAYLPGYGWLGLDPTNNCVANENHVRLAVGKNYYDCSPVRGTYRGTSKHKLDVSVTVSYENGDNFAESNKAVEISEPSKENSFQRHQQQMQQQ
jgi:transglutaminase-like putative cysteine protease